MKKLTFVILLFLSGQGLFSQASTCADAEPFCADETYVFQNTTGTTAEGGNNYDCLLQQPNPAWYYMEIDEGGTMAIEISQQDANGSGLDVDFILYGPYPDYATAMTYCGSMGTAGSGAGINEVIDCSYDPDPVEIAEFGNAQPGEVYVMMITNFSDQPGTITFEQVGGTATTDCGIVEPQCPTIGFDGFDYNFNTGQIEGQIPLDATVPCDYEYDIVFQAHNVNTAGGYITPGYYIEVFPTNANTNNEMYFYEDGDLLGGFYPGSPAGVVPQNSNFTGTVSYVSPSAGVIEIELCNPSTGADMPYEVYDLHSGALIASGTWTAGTTGCQTISFPGSNITGFAQYTCPTCPAGSFGTTDWGGGIFSPELAGPGSYDITYTFDPENGSDCETTHTHNVTVTNPYDATWTNPGPFCITDADVDLNDYLDGSATTGGTWSGPGVTGSTFSPAGAGDGTHAVTYSVGINADCSDELTLNIEVNPQPDATADNTGPYCPGDVIELEGNTTTTGTDSYSWTGPNGYTSTNQNPTNATDAGDYELVVTVDGCNSDPVTTTVVINPEPDATASNTGPYCPGDNIELEGSTTTAGTDSYNWTGPNGYTSTDQNPTDATEAGDYELVVTVDGCNSDPVTTTVVINPEPDATASNTGPYCPGDNIELEGSTTTAGTDSYSWTGPNGYTSTDQNPTDATEEGEYELVVTVNGCESDPVTTQVTFNGLDDASFNYSGSTFCITDPNNPTPTITGETGGTFVIDAPGVIDPATGEIDLGASGLGTFDITYTVDVVCENSETVTITITDSPNAEFSYAQTEYCQNGTDPSVDLAPGASAGVFSADPTGLVINANNGTINLSDSDPGVYVVTNFIAATGGCVEESHDFTIEILPEDDASFSYDASFYCTATTSVFPTIDGLPGGTFSEATGNLDIDPATGEINPSNSQVGGPYTVVYETNGPCPTTADFEVSITENPDATIDPVAPLCEYDDPITLTAAENNGVWTGTGVTDNGDGTGTFDPSVGEGSYDVTYTISGDCEDDDMITIEVLPTNTAEIISAEGVVFCLDHGTITLEGNDVNGTWDTTSGGFTDNGDGTAEFDVTAAGIGSHQIEFITTGDCPETTDITIQVVDSPDAPTIESDTICINEESVLLSDENITGDLNWYDENGDLIQISETFEPEIDTVGVYTFCVSQTIGDCESELHCFEIYVGNPNADFEVDPAVGSVPFSLNLTNNSTDADSYEWDFGNDETSEEVEPEFTYDDWGNFELTLYAMDEYGCEDVHSVTIIVDAESTLEVPNIFSPNGDGKNDVFRLIGGNLRSVDAMIFNRWGQLIYSWETVNGGWDGRTNSGIEASEGTYFYKISAVGADNAEYEFQGTVRLVR